MDSERQPRRFALPNLGPRPVRRRGRARPLGLLLLGGLAAGCATHAQSRAQAETRWNDVRARIKLQLAKQQFENGQVDAAATTVTEAVAAEPTLTDGHLLLAQCYLEQGKFAAAGQAVTDAEGCDPQSAEAAYMRGLLAERADQIDVAVEHYRRARMRQSNMVDYVVSEAECLAALGRTDEALKLVNENLGRVDSDGTLEALAAQLALLEGDPEAAVRNLRLAIERAGCVTASAPRSTSCDALIEQCGRLLSETGRHAEAVALLGPYVAARPDAPASVIQPLAAGYLALERFDEAKHLLRDDVRRHADQAPSWMLLAQAAMRSDDWMTARRCAERLRQLAPQSPEVLLLQGFVCWKQNDRPAATAALQRVLAQNPDDALAHGLLGRLLDDVDQAAAAEHYRRAAQLDPQTAWITRR
jgi:Tfp pilus assembly protein PilF